MEYLNRDRLERVSDKSFQTRQPYPWVDIDGILTPEGHELLPPEPARFFDVRAAGSA